MSMLSAPASSTTRARQLSWQVGAVVAGSIVLALSSYIEVPMVPVPITMQTLAVTLAGGILGRRLGALTVMAWLAQGMAGLPVLAGGAGGIHHFAGPTAGYLAAFPIMAWMTGWLAENGWNGLRPWRAFAGMLGAHLLCLALGGAWLAGIVGPTQAVALGVTPFLVGAVLKSALGAALLALLARRRPRKVA
ncbi:biotin transporter BioY [Aureimonas sp. OT7]|uniref:biotin transporter BioY n=1 Tax=Aureimonas TaxID=414371 RepID=UPI001781ACE3|nr:MULTISPECIES: biotin transporter BioY [Aureimonas]QOG08216.1 biotin transporter BioY [Aureimonas sp. OT7]